MASRQRACVAPTGVKTDDGCKSVWPKAQLLPRRGEESWGDSEATVVRRLRSNRQGGASESIWGVRSGNGPPESQVISILWNHLMLTGFPSTP